MKDIAIIGVAGRFPDAGNIQELYENLKKGHCSAKPISKDRKRSTNLEVNQEYKVFSFLEHIDLFDHKFFKLSMAEAQTMDPHQRLLLEVVYETFESACYNPDHFWGSNTSVFCGDVSLSYYNLATQYDPTLITGNLNTVTASRISRIFNLRGTNLMVDTNCSSTLMATHLACNELINGDSEYSIVCGVRLILRPNKEDHKKDDVGIMAFDGKTRSFSADAEGTGAGEAVACVLLKPLDKAKADGDLIYGVIKATAVNQEAMLSGSLTAPSSKAQAEVIQKAWKKADIDPKTIGYIEPHGSGTKLGDPIEIQGIDQAFEGLNDQKHAVAVSALKSNIGHTDTVAGLSGMVKVMLSLQNKQLFPTCNFAEPNPFIDFDNSVSYINTELKPWTRNGNSPLRAGLSSFGLSGTNCHVILEEAPEKQKSADTGKTEILCLSATSETALIRNINRLQDYLAENENSSLADLSRTLNQGRKHYAHRIAILAENTLDFRKQLGEISKKSISNQEVGAKKLVLIFPDKIDEAEELKSQLVAHYPEFKANLEKCRALAGNQSAGSYPDFELQYALYFLLEQHGISSKNLLGIGVGKTVIDAVLNKRTLAECTAEAEQLSWQEIPDFGKRFQALIDRETETEKAFFIELAPLSVFTKHLKHLKHVQTPGSSDYFEWFGLTYHPGNSLKLLIRELYLKQAGINWELAQEKDGNKIWLPPYSFEPIRCWLREPSPDEETRETKPAEQQKSKDSNALKRVIPTHFDSSKVKIDESWSATEKQIALFWVEILKLDEISLDDDFFKLGGHSLLATQLISRIEKKYQVRLEFKNIAQFSSIKSLAEGVNGLLASGEGKSRISPIVKTEQKPFYPVSKAQYRQWLLNQFDPFSLAYNLPLIININHELDPKKVEQAILKIIAKHESLRTSFGTENGEPVQYIHDETTFQLEHIQIKQEEINATIQDFIRPFNLTKAPLFRVRLAQIETGRFIFMSDIHHIVSDGVSSGIILSDFSKASQGIELDELEYQYKDFSEWQNRQLESGEMQKQEDFWLAQFKDRIPVLDLPSDFKRPLVKTNLGARITYVLDEKRTEKIKKFSQESGTTIFMTLLAMYKVLLHKYSGSEDIVVGSAVAGRSRQEVENIIGMFVNTLAIRNYPKKEQSFRNFLAELKENTMSIFEHQDYPFEMLVDKLDIKRDLSRNPLFDTMFSYQNYYRDEHKKEVSRSDKDISPFGFEGAVSKFDLTFEVIESSDQLSFLWEYSTELFKKESMERMVEHLNLIIDTLTAHPDLKLKELSLVSGSELELLDSFNQTQRSYELSENIVGIWQKSVSNFGQNPALRFQDQELTYEEVDQLTDQLAFQIRENGIGQGQVVAIQPNPSLEMFVGVLAILKSGAAFLPLDQTQPEDRVNVILNESEASLYLHYGLKNKPNVKPVPALEIDLEQLRIQRNTFKKTELKPDDPAYIIYTSGSTGKPKGIAISHRSLSNLLCWYQEKYQLQATDRISKFAGFGFDATIIELFPPFLTGASLHIIPDEARKDLNQLHQILTEQQISVAFLPTAIAELYMDFDNPILKKLLIGGSKLGKYVDKPYEIYDNYGPSEDTVITTCSETSVNSKTNRLSIGKLIANKQIYILEPGTFNRCPIGIKGEILISGEGVALGYWKNETLTKQVFVDNPFIPGTKMYHSGDLGRWLPDGSIEFFGRIDHQVKINGNRIEPEEITHSLTKHTALSEAFVTAMEIDAELSLVAYYVAKEKLDSAILKNFLQDKLPAYMIPSYWMPLEKLPVTVNGKIDLKNLPVPEKNNSEEDKKQAESVSEELVLSLFREILRYENIGTDENFFEIGGHSLKATQLLSALYKKSGVQVPLKDLFLDPTVSGLAHCIDHRVPEEKIETLPKAVKKEHYALSSSQNRLHFLQQLNPKSIAYNIPGALRMKGKLDEEQFITAFEKLTSRHDSLRTSFQQTGDEIRQVVSSTVKPDIILGSCTEAEIQERISSFVRPYDLQKAPLMRICLLTISDEDHLLLFDVHHIICDGSSMILLIDEFFQLYQDRELKPLVYQYIDYSEWQNSPQGISSNEKQKNYWMELFAENTSVLELPTDFPRPEMHDYKGARTYFRIDNEQLEKIKTINQKYGTTNFMFFLAAFKLFLSKQSTQEDICVGTPVAGRKHRELDQIVGMFVNTLALRSRLKPEMSFVSLLEQVKENVINALENQEYPYEELLDKLDIPRNTSRNPLFDVFFVYQNLNKPAENKLDQQLQLSPVGFETSVSKFDLTLEIQENETNLQLIFEYATSLFKAESIARFIRHFTKLLDELISNPELLTGSIELMDENEKQQLLVGFNNTSMLFDTQSNVCKLIETQAEQNPKAIALIFEEQTLSYGELNKQANQLAHYLIAQHQLGEGKIVALVLDRSDLALISILAVLKTGAAYVPVDITYPDERIAYILENSDASLILSKRDLSHKFQKTTPVIFAEDLADTLREYAHENPGRKQTDKQRAYVIYTSGSTGQPKGCEISHGNLMNYIAYANATYFGSEAPHFGLFTSLAFDLTLTSIFCTLTQGGSLTIYPEKEEINNILSTCFSNKSQVDTVKLTPSHLSLLNHLELKESNIKTIIVGGEQLNIQQVDVLRNLNPKSRIFNEYGPTETTVGCVAKEILPGETRILIGKPIANTQIYILDQQQALVPISCPGEIYISGAGVGMGYLNRLELSSERFIPDPFQEGQSMYRSGDLACWHPDGNIEYFGRIDEQVKIRGYRIEPGEIEHAMLKLPQVKEVVVLAKTATDGEHFLVAYFVPGDENTGQDDLRSLLGQSLPDYMIPQVFVALEQIPLSSNGKIDRKALAGKELSSNLQQEYLAPETETERELCVIWEEILGIRSGEQQIGVRHNFFEIGGHSLKATIMVTRIQKKLGVTLSLIELFKNPTIRALAKVIDKSEQSIYTAITPVPQRAFYPASSAQKRLYVISQINERGTQYNMPYALEILGDIDFKSMEYALDRLIKRHESLRTCFELNNSEIVQRIHEQVSFEVNYIACFENELDEKVSQHIQPFDLHQVPLVRVFIFQTETNRNIVLFDMHHALSDGLSMQILSAEFIQLYQGKTLPELHLHYRDYAVWQQEFFHKHENQKQEDFWLNQFSGDLPLLNLPLDFTRPPIQSYEGETVHFQLSTELVDGLKAAALRAKSTSFMYLFAVYNVLLAKYCSQDDIVVGTPVAGRPHADLHLLIGMFVNTLAVRNHPKAEKSFEAFLEELTHNTLSCMDHQEFPFEDLVDQVVKERDMSRNPLFDVMFSYQNLQVGENKEPVLRFRPFGVQVNTSKFDLQLDVMDFEKSIQLGFTYCSKLWKRESIEGIVNHFVNLLEQLVGNEQQLIGNLELASDSEKQQILLDFNDTKHDFEDQTTLHELFERQVERSPDALALVFENESLTYRELNQKSNQLAYLLRDLGVGADDLVPLLIDRSFEMVIGMLAIQKAGGAYMPLDPEVPAERLTYLLSDSKAKVLLSDKDLDLAVKSLNLKDKSLYSGSSENLVPVSSETNLAYVIYTSGSTGNPKGVLLEHRGVVNRIQWMKEFYGFSSAETVLQKTTYTFDVSVWEFFMTLCYGAKLVLCKKEVISDVSLLMDVIEREKVSVLHFVPSMFKVFLAGIDEKNAIRLSSIKQVFASGEALPAESVQAFHRYLKAELHNLYGPTEASVDVSYYETKAGDTLIPIGKPVWNTKLLILDKNLNILPIGVPGELHIGGVQLARGYLNQVELTAEKFISSPFRENERLYKTGDLARWLPDGNIEYLGRIDQQVKIRGFRIELGDIESQLLKIEGFAEVAVVDKTDKNGDKFLCAYIVSKNELNISEIKAELAKDLPEYMLPSYFVKMEAMPLGSSGKLKRKALPEPDETALEKAEYVAPETEIEVLLTQIWQQVLGIATIGVHDNFFNLGGDSLKAIQLSAILLKSRYKLELSNLFQFPTIREVAKTIRKSSLKIPQEAISGEVQLSPVQKRFFEKSYPKPEHYNQAIMLESHQVIDTGTIQKVLNQLTIHHDALRIVFNTTNGKPIQFNRPPEAENSFTFNFFDLSKSTQSEADIQLKASELQTSFQLFEGNLFQAAIFHTPKIDYLLLIAHHLIVDAFSWRTLIEDLITGYRQSLNGQIIRFEEKTHSYQHWSQAIQEYAHGAGILNELDYWKAIDNKSVRKLDKNGSTNAKTRAESKNFSLSAQHTETLLKHINRVYQTEINDVLLTALGMAVKSWSGQDEIRINLEGHGREDILENTEISRTVGWFTSIFPVHISAKAATIDENIRLNRDSMKAVPNKGIGYGILRYLTPSENKSGFEFKSEPEIIFNYLGQLGSSGNKPNPSESKTEAPTGLILSGMGTGLSLAPENEAEYSLNISALVSNGELNVTISYFNEEFDSDNILQLAAAYQQELTAILKRSLELSISPEHESKTFDVMEGLEQLITTPVMMLKDNRQKQNIFFFPPAIGFSMIYQDLASNITAYNVYGINFLEADSRMDTYIEKLIEINGDKPFIFAGYSGGANLAYQVALELNNKGFRVSDIIMLDGMRTMESVVLSEEELQEKTLQYISDEEGHPSHRILKTQSERDRVRIIVRAFQRFLSEQSDDGMLDCNVHQIYSEQDWEEGNIRKEKWMEVISGKFNKYQGIGEHGSMLHMGNLETNAGIFNRVLAQLELSDSEKV